jgi:Ulp1 family protease
MSLDSADFRNDQLVVNYNDACIYGRDLNLLLSHSWLNDACIHYQFNRLQHEYDRDNKTLRLLDPAIVSFFMHQCEDDDELAEFASGHDCFRTTRRILIPINDTMTSNNSSWSIPGQGTHWSLLAMERSLDFDDDDSSSQVKTTCYHFDSVPRSRNSAAANEVATKMQTLLQSITSKTDAHVPSGTGVVVHECDVPKQSNSYDCGVHVLATAETLLQDEGVSCTHVGERLTKLFQKNPTYCSDLRVRITEDILAQVAK